MQHETLAMYKDADPLGLSVNHWICHLDGFHMSVVAPVSKVLVDSEVVEVVGTFKTLDSGPQCVKFCHADPPGPFAS